MKNKIITYQEVKIKLEQWCAYQDRCLFEVKEKINTYKLNDSDTLRLINELKTDNFLDENRFVASFISGKFRIKNWGRNKIKHHLIQKKIDKDLIINGIYSINDNEYNDTIEKLILKKLNELKPKLDTKLSEYQTKGKVFSYLTSKGFEFDLINNCYELLNLRNVTKK